MSDVTGTYYAAAGARHGYGTQLMVGDGASPENFQAVANVMSITPGDMNTAVIDRTHLRSPDAHREKMAGIRDSGPFTAELIWDPSDESHSNVGGGSGAFASGGLVYIWRNRLEKNYKIVLADNTEWPFRGVITKFQPGVIGIDDKIGATVEITPLQAFDAALP